MTIGRTRVASKLRAIRNVAAEISAMYEDSEDPVFIDVIAVVARLERLKQFISHKQEEISK